MAIGLKQSCLPTVWQRAFASKTDKDLWWGCIGATIFIFITLTLVGVTGMIALWAPGVLPEDPSATDYAFFYLIATLPNWVVGICLVFAVALSCAAYDTMQTGKFILYLGLLTSGLGLTHSFSARCNDQQ